jgi:hypothetical protein
MLEALVAGEGLSRVAEIAAGLVGAEVGIFVPRPGSDGSAGSAAERYVAALVAGGDPAQPAEVTEVVPIVSQDDMQGAVLMFGEGREDAFEYLTVAAVASLTGVAMLNAREDAARGADDNLLADLLAGDVVRPGEVIRRAQARGCDLAGGVSALCIKPGGRPTGGLIAAVAAERPDALAEVSAGRVYILLPGTIEEARRLAGQLDGRGTVALSSRYREATDARLALEEADLLLTMAEAGGLDSASTPSWDSIRILFRTFVADPDELARFSEETVGPLVGYDEQQGSELQATFWAYQESNCNMNLTAKATYTHRHTVSNRLARIEELTGLDPSQSYERELLSMALKSHYVIAMSRPRGTRLG